MYADEQIYYNYAIQIRQGLVPLSNALERIFFCTFP